MRRILVIVLTFVALACNRAAPERRRRPRTDDRRVREGRPRSADRRPDQAVLTHAPKVPPPTSAQRDEGRSSSSRCVEKVKRIADGVDYTFWTFGGAVPGKFIRVREGDLVEFT